MKPPPGAATYARHQAIIEPRLGQRKPHDGFRRWTGWGLEAVRTQWPLRCATLNPRILYRRGRAGRGGGRGERGVGPAGPGGRADGRGARRRKGTLAAGEALSPLRMGFGCPTHALLSLLKTFETVSAAKPASYRWSS